MSTTVHQPTAKHNEYSPLWQKCRDAVKGHDHIQSKDTTYLPKLSGQEKDDYKKYKKQALFYNASGRTFEGYKGLIFRKDPDISGEQIPDFVEDSTLSGTSLEEFAETAVEEELKTSRFGILVDYPSVAEGSNMSQAEAEQQGIRPFLVAYKAEDIIGDPETIKVGGRTVLGKIRLLETYQETDPEDEFKKEEKERVRVLDLTADHPFGGDAPVYRQRVFHPKDKDSDEWIENEDERWFPKMEGAPIKEIPFYIVGGYEYRTPHMIDLVNVNLSHYVAYADHRQGVAWTTRPQPWASGNSDDDIPDNPVLGGGQLWNFPNPDSSIGMLEYSGSGLTASEKNLDKLEEMMANLGARMLMPEDMSNTETATEFVIKKQGENSALANVANLVSKALTKAIQFAARWMGAADPEEVRIELNTDFIPFDMSVEDMVKLWGLKQAGGITEKDYLWNIKQGERVDPTIEDEERISEMQTETPPGMNFSQNGDE